MKTYQFEYRRACAHCEAPFTTHSRAGRYCSPACRNKAGRKRHQSSAAGAWLRQEILCGVCETPFFRTEETGPNKKYCSPACSKEAQGRDVAAFKLRQPGAMARYNQTRVKKHGRDTLINRLRKRYPDLPAVCEAQSCGEARVLELCHKPEFARRGRHRTLDLYERHMFWVLCPTCHKVLDRGIETPEQMGLT